MKKTISIVTPTFNEEKNIDKFCNEISETMKKLDYNYEHIVIDNSSTDSTVEKLKKIAVADKNLKIIVNEKNFGIIRSPFHGLLQSTGDATILMSADFQEPINLIPEYIKKWQEGFKVVLGKKKNSKINFFNNSLKKISYKILKFFSETEIAENANGTGIFDKDIIIKLKKIEDPYPFFRGLIFEITSNISYVEYTENKREDGESKNNFLVYYDYATLALVKHSKKPLRYISIFGFIFSIFSLLIAIFFFMYKLLFWDSFQLGVAPIIVGLFSLMFLQLFFLGFIGEYILQILNYQKKFPHVIEKERINFD